MKKLLSLLSVLTISGTAVPTIVANKPYVITAYTNDVINLNNLKVKNLSIDLNYLYNKNPAPTEDDIKEAILIAIASNNDSTIYEVIISILTEIEKWKISGINFEIPKLGESSTYDSKFLSLDSSKYIGVLSAKVTVSNLNNIKDLNDVITNKNLNTIVNPDKNEILKVLKEKNSDLDISEIDIQDWTYKNANIKAKENSSKYFSSVIVSFTSVIQLNGANWESEYISLSSYSGPETKTSEHEFNYKLTFGKEEFIKSFNKINIIFSGDAITSRPQWVEKYFKDETKSFSIPSDSNKENFWYEEQQWYGNYDASAAWLETYWKDDNTFVLKAVAYVKVDSSAISTDHSRAKTQLIIKGISFK
ncbi:hypothetical protein [Spiroplasma endosymbiont of Seladonia tumulorum]|uniref:hypothetical protein n=1 Tax=Spiroplasma endosymbiont of Seladonia tumulorum TaxID=3066321 RepID=UPI0030D09FE4